MNLVIIYGLPAVGKLTVAKELSTMSGYRLFHNHLAFDYAHAFFEFGTEEFINLRDELWIKGFKLAKEKELPGLIFTFVFEKTVKTDFIDRVKGILGTDDNLFLIYLKCSREELLKRVSSDERKHTGKIKSPEKLAKSIDEGFVYIPEISEGVVELDTTNLRPEETAKQILDYINKQGEV